MPESAKKTNILNDKFAVIVHVLANPAYRNRRKMPPLTHLDCAVFARLVQRYNIKWGYSATSTRSIAEELNASNSTVARSIKKLIDEGLLEAVGEERRGKTGRYAPIFEVCHAIAPNSEPQNEVGVFRAIEGNAADAGYGEEHRAPAYSKEHTVPGYGEEPKGMKRNLSEVERNDAALRSSPSTLSGSGSASRGKRSKKKNLGKIDIEQVLKNLNGGL